MPLQFLIMSVMVLVLCTGSGFSQTITGTLDRHWSYNSNNHATPINSFRAFDLSDQPFFVNSGELVMDYKPKDVGVRVDISFGDAAEIVHNNVADRNIWRHVEQAYITASKGKFTVDFGKWVTPIGAEVIESKDNWNYTRGLLFSFAKPFYHFGAKSTYVASDRVTLTGFVVNEWNNIRGNNTATSLGFVGIFKPMKKVGLTTNFLIGKENPAGGYRQLYDGLVTYKATKRISIMANYDYTRDKSLGRGVFWQGVAVYGKAKVSNKLTVASRYEWFGDRHNAFKTGTNQYLQSFTGTAQIPRGDVTLWGEYRRDWSNVATFFKTEGAVSSPVDNQNTFTLGLTYSFTRW